MVALDDLLIVVAIVSYCYRILLQDIHKYVQHFVIIQRNAFPNKYSYSIGATWRVESVKPLPFLCSPVPS